MYVFMVSRSGSNWITWDDILGHQSKWKENLVDTVEVTFLARQFSKKTTRYCHSSGDVCVCVVVVVQKVGHFVISLSLPKYLLETRTSCSLWKGELIPIGEVTLKIFLAQLCPFFDLEFLLKNVKHALYISKRNCSRALAPACGVLVNNHHKSWWNCLSCWFLGQVWKWVTWGRKLGHWFKSQANFVNTLEVFRLLEWSSWVVLKMFGLMILGQVQNFFTWGQKLGCQAKLKENVNTLEFTFLARLFSKKTTRYCHSSGVVCFVVVQKFGHFVISLSLLKIFTWNSDYMFIMKRGNSYQ